MMQIPTTRTESIAFYGDFLAAAAARGPAVLFQCKRWLARNDLFFLLVNVCRRQDMNRDWLFDRCREVQAKPNGILDLWAREHFKSTIITFGLSLQDILASHGEAPEARYNGREVTIGILSFNRPTAKGFLRQIKYEMETNDDLKALFPDILYERPGKQSPKWSEDEGLIVKRKTNPKEATVEAHGMIDGMPTGKHFFIRNYDDVITKEAVTNPEMINKVTTAWELSDSLGTEGGIERYIGTRYALFDTYAVMMERGIPARLHPATSDGSEDFSKAVLMKPSTLAKKRRKQGPYTFGCFPAGAPVLMADWTERPVEALRVGDDVVGYDFPKAAKSKLVRAKVLAINTRVMPVIEATFASGRKVRCTAEHKWYTGRRGVDVGGSDNHSAYLPLGFQKDKLKALISVYDPRAVNAPFDIRGAAWLGGFFDGEGAVSGGQIHFHQSSDHNLIVCDRLEHELRAAGFDYGMTDRVARSEKWSASRDYYIRGGRQEHIRFLRQCRPARAQKIIDGLYERGTRSFGKVCRDDLVSIEQVGEEPVFNIETTTGNYVCYGYATKNSQMLLNPTADKAQGFKREWLKYWPARHDTNLTKVLIVDPASKKKTTSDYTTMWVIGLGGDKNYYVVDCVRDRLNLTDRAKALFSLHKRHRPRHVGYEEYGLQADIEHMNYVMGLENYRFDITALGGKTAKIDRIKSLVPTFEMGRILLPESGILYTDYENRTVDLVRIFIQEEYEPFPVLMHDDMLDCLARLNDPDFQLSFPEPIDEEAQPRWMRAMENAGMEGADDFATF